jgi:aminodeoxyfutalosine synthase
MKPVFLDPDLEPIHDKILRGERLSFEDGIALYKSTDLIGVGRLADHVRRKQYDRKAFFVVNRHLNYTNVCMNQCRFCAYARQEGASGSYTMSLEQAKEWVRSHPEKTVHEIHIVGGLNPALSMDYYIDLLNTVKAARPEATIKAFTAVEIDRLAVTSGKTIHDVIRTLKDAGLEMLPGGGAEIMSDRVRNELFPRKIDYRRWLEIIEAVHRAGLKTNATMLYGHIETLEERVAHLLHLRTLQDKTGGFLAFIPLAFHSGNTKLSHLPPTTAMDDLKTIAVSRLLLDNIPHIKAYWVMIGEKLAQVALSFGADDLDGTIVEEKITHTAGATSAKGLTRPELVRLITAAGFEPVERDAFYTPVEAQQKRGAVVT